MSTEMPSFDKAQYALAPNPASTLPDYCKTCQQPIAGSYYRVNGDIACQSCATQANAGIPPDSHSAFTRAILYGIGAAIVGMIGYALFEIGTGITIGYLAIGVGFIIGKAMKLGSKGRGGRRYQIAAAILTYASVSMAAVPVAIYDFAKHPAKQAAPAQTTTADQAAAEHPYPGDPAPEKKSAGIGMVIVTLIGLGLASPFLELSEGIGGFIGLFILFIGIRYAWNLMGRHDSSIPEVSGPFSNQQPETA